MPARKGYVIFDGLDGVGKGEGERALIEAEQKEGRTTFDSISFSKASRKLPELRDFWNPPHLYFDTVIVAEPTYAGIGHTIRTEIINTKNRGRYSAETEISTYGDDRLVQLHRLILPALDNGLRVNGSRCLAASLTYQVLRAKQEHLSVERIKRRILSHPGNKLQLANAPGLLIIPTIKDPRELEERLKKRSAISKDDNSIFENLSFQKALKPLYESRWLKNIFEDAGTRVEYIDAGISPEATRQQARDIYRNYLVTA